MPMMAQCFRAFFTDNNQFEAELNDNMNALIFDNYYCPPGARPDPNGWTHFLADSSVTELPLTRHTLRVTCVKADETK